MKKLIVISVLSALLSCKSSSSKNKAVSEQAVKTNSVKSINTTVKVKKDNASTSEELIVENDNSISKKLIGAWALNGSANATFEITKSNFYYPEHSSSYKYKIIGDSIKVKYDDYEGSFAFKIIGNDTYANR